ncbi:MAG TPA: hypothetical protein DIU15_04110, partial [Deltaproteobacteria bacterium]|nr:hypothetical protein [Deltaproteobacteria bacterium]
MASSAGADCAFSWPLLNRFFSRIATVWSRALQPNLRRGSRTSAHWPVLLGFRRALGWRGYVADSTPRSSLLSDYLLSPSNSRPNDSRSLAVDGQHRRFLGLKCPVVASDEQGMRRTSSLGACAFERRRRCIGGANWALLLPLWTVLLLPSVAEAEVIVDSQAAHDDLLAANPEAGQPGVIDFEGMPFAVPVANQFLSEGVAFDSSADIFPVPQAFGSAGNGAQVAAVGFGLIEPAELVFLFPEPQRAFSTLFLDVGSAMTVETFLDGVLQETFTLLAVAEDQDGGEFRGVWFDTFADEVHLTTDAAEDGIGIDDFSVSAPGTVDNDLDGFSEVDGDCDDADPLLNPGLSDTCDDGIDNDCDGLVDVGVDVDEDGADSCIDCDDNDADVRPGVVEECDDGIDNDCSGDTNDAPDVDGDGFGPCDGDCLDTSTSVFPGATELCDGVDNDCDGV